MATEKTSVKGQAWFCTTGIPSDVVVEVDDMTFHLHKFPLMSKSGKLARLIREQEENPASKPQKPDENGEEIEEEEEEVTENRLCHIILQDFPGGSDTFEAAAKFCYQVKIELTASNVAPLRCAGEVLEMTEEFSEDNLIAKTEMFLTQTVLKIAKESIRALISCDGLVPLAESLGIVERCIDSVAVTASSSDPALFGWPVNDAGKSKTGGNGNGTSSISSLDDLGLLSLPLFMRLISSMKTREISASTVENCLVSYAKRNIPGITRSNRRPSASSTLSENEQKVLLETIVASLPLEINRSLSPTMVRLFFGLLRTANILSASETCRSVLERKIGWHLEQATLDDLLIPSYSYLNETLYDVDCVERILNYFLLGLEERSSNRIEGEDENSGLRTAALMLVGKLIDGYLSEIASDANLKPERFCQLAVALPEHARVYDDGLYRSVDVYLKAHPWITEADREKICGVMDCQKLTLEACTHAAQNERLPLRAVVQVLFFEQLQLRQAIAGTLVGGDMASLDSERPSPMRILEEEEVERVEEDRVVEVEALSRSGTRRSTWRKAARENQVLKLDMDSMRTRVHELERECSTMKKAIEQIDKMEPTGGRRKGSITKKFGCKFNTQVCDSREPSATIVHARKGKNHHRH